MTKKQNKQSVSVQSWALFQAISLLYNIFGTQFFLFTPQFYQSWPKFLRKTLYNFTEDKHPAAYTSRSLHCFCCPSSSATQNSQLSVRAKNNSRAEVIWILASIHFFFFFFFTFGVNVSEVCSLLHSISVGRQRYSNKVMARMMS